MKVDNTIKLDGTFIKTLCSGGDEYKQELIELMIKIVHHKQHLFFVVMIYRK